MNRRIIRILSGAALAILMPATTMGAALAGPVPPTGPTHPHYVPGQHQYWRNLPPCATEDTTVGPCKWDATVRGNGQGRSFVVRTDGTIRYVNFNVALYR